MAAPLRKRPVHDNTGVKDFLVGGFLSFWRRQIGAFSHEQEGIDYVTSATREPDRQEQKQENERE
jgi:hypothetical protein